MNTRTEWFYIFEENLYWFLDIDIMHLFIFISFIPQLVAIAIYISMKVLFIVIWFEDLLFQEKP